MVMSTFNHISFQRFSLLSCIILILNAGTALSASLFYLGMWDTANHATGLNQYAVEGSMFTPMVTPFNQYSFLEFSPAGILYGVEDATLSAINPMTGETTNEITLNDGTSAIVCSGFTFMPDGTMLVHEYSNRTGAWMHKLYSGDPATGTLTFIADITGVSGLYGIGYANGVLYGSYDNHLYSIDMTTGAATSIGTSSSAWDLSFGSDGVMRGTEPSPDDGAIYAINLSNGSATLIKSFQTDLNQVAVGLEVICSPVISVQPVSQWVQAGHAMTLSVTANGTAMLSYRWQRQDNTNAWVDIENAIAHEYTLNPFANVNAGGYRCLVSNLAGFVTSNRVSLNAGDANRDGAVDVGDLGILAANYGGLGKNWSQGDFNGDGLVDVGDLGILAANYGQGSNNSMSVGGDTAQALGTTTIEDKENNSTIGSTACSGLGLPLIASLMLIGFWLGNFRLKDH